MIIPPSREETIESHCEKRDGGDRSSLLTCKITLTGRNDGSAQLVTVKDFNQDNFFLIYSF